MSTNSYISLARSSQSDPKVFGSGGGGGSGLPSHAQIRLCVSASASHGAGTTNEQAPTQPPIRAGVRGSLQHHFDVHWLNPIGLYKFHHVFHSTMLVLVHVTPAAVSAAFMPPSSLSSSSFSCLHVCPRALQDSVQDRPSWPSTHLRNVLEPALRSDAANGGTDAANGGTDAANGGTDAANGGTDAANGSGVFPFPAAADARDDNNTSNAVAAT